MLFFNSFNNNLSRNSAQYVIISWSISPLFGIRRPAVENNKIAYLFSLFMNVS